MATDAGPDTGPPVVVYCGHMFNAGSDEEAALAVRIAEALDRLGARVGFGPLACGADILVAEALLARGGELNVVLPFAEEDFVAESVLCGGEAWLARYRACRDAAASVHFATPGAYVGDDNQFAYNTRLAMGLAALRAQQIEVEAVQVAVISDKFRSLSKTGLAGTLADIGMWQALGRETVTIPAGPVPRDLVFPPHPPIAGGTRREIRSILFADYKGFSRLGERELPLFMAEVMGRIGAVLGEFGDHVEFRNTWGDAIYAVVDTPRVAARLALALQQRLEDLPLALIPPGGEAGMRIGVHYGPIWQGTDRITGNRIWYGGEVNRTARIEPVTPVGGVYCTESFAAALLIDQCDECRFISVGHKPLAKEFGEIELYRLEGI
ncbi:adenylate/guanylate cyclase domain-containing protein [Novosphingobium sp. JCM 18896]|uniref:adenylate/guanylate cyclase domain-containing protein n=1 Tax=Novosphingobium sp. JCM 18896 TaxID=2989731 RepID=UPI00222354EB|nr:adenylate/guanylate cyclase domain-containing protein [Novosphingobium sp. JCM 18896]MCW1429199.1 adenylate/guanylate cyclase domain-containing protein [Novosphingobium sp. JCM 18896]